MNALLEAFRAGDGVDLIRETVPIMLRNLIETNPRAFMKPWALHFPHQPGRGWLSHTLVVAAEMTHQIGSGAKRCHRSASTPLFANLEPGTVQILLIPHKRTAMGFEWGYDRGSVHRARRVD